MLKTSRGFTFPVTMIIISIFTLFIIYYCELFLSEKEIYSLSETILREEYYLAHAVKFVERELQMGNFNLTAGRFNYDNGYINYNIIEIDPELFQINFDGYLNNNVSWSGSGIYDKTEQKMVRWIERK